MLCTRGLCALEALCARRHMLSRIRNTTQIGIVGTRGVSGNRTSSSGNNGPRTSGASGGATDGRSGGRGGARSSSNAMSRGRHGLGDRRYSSSNTSSSGSRRYEQQQRGSGAQQQHSYSSSSSSSSKPRPLVEANINGDSDGSDDDDDDDNDDGATADGVPTATFVPRDRSGADGPWTRADAALVAAAQADSAAAAAAAAAAVLAPPPITGGKAAAAAGAEAAAGAVLLGQPEAALRDLAVALGHPAFRGSQVRELLLKAARDPATPGARSVEEMHTLPRQLREQLAALNVATGRAAVHHEAASPCGTRKLLLQVADGRLIETVGIPVAAAAATAAADRRPGAAGRARRGGGGRTGSSNNGDGDGSSNAGSGGGALQRLTVCVSSQVGCPLRCTFCATGRGGFSRNLRPHEIFDQVLTMQELFKRRVSNVVFMGQGEPLLNLPAVAEACRLLREELGLSGRGVTISTVGVPNTIRRLAALKLPATLAVSLHAPNQELRERLIPSAKAYPLQALMADCAAYFATTKRRVTFEYTLMAGVNDRRAHAEELARLLRAHRVAHHVNVIPWNPVDESEYRRPSTADVAAFRRALDDAGVPNSLRITRGLEASAACGQLRNSFQKQPLPEPQPMR